MYYSKKLVYFVERENISLEGIIIHFNSRIK